MFLQESKFSSWVFPNCALLSEVLQRVLKRGQEGRGIVLMTYTNHAPSIAGLCHLPRLHPPRPRHPLPGMVFNFLIISSALCTCMYSQMHIYMFVKKSLAIPFCCMVFSLHLKWIYCFRFYVELSSGEILKRWITGLFFPKWLSFVEWPLSACTKKKVVCMYKLLTKADWHDL